MKLFFDILCNFVLFISEVATEMNRNITADPLPTVSKPPMSDLQLRKTSKAHVLFSFVLILS